VHAKTGRPVVVGRKEVMSKSKKNVVPPAAIIDAYGADTARLFVLSDSPPERDLEWTAAGVEGAWRYINRVFRLIAEPPMALPPPDAAMPGALSSAATAIRRATHQAIKAVTESIDGFRFNVAVAQIRTLSNALEAADGPGVGVANGGVANGGDANGGAADGGEAWALREGFEALAQLIAPMTPHLAEELWQLLGHKGLIVDRPWPTFDARLTVEDSVTLAVQVNGKLKDTITLPRNIAAKDAEAAALALPAVQRTLDGKMPRKVIVVPNRIVNVVA
jgi:leucyl-tRNA synthetase